MVIWLPPPHTLLSKTRNHIKALENVVGNIIFQPLQIDFIPFPLTSKTLLVYLSPVLTIWSIGGF